MGSVNEGMRMTQQFEGFREQPYLDTRGIPTIGYGFNMKANPGLPAYMTPEQAQPLFNKFYGEADQRARKFVGSSVYDSLTPNQMNILTDMAYNLGDRLNGFERMRAAIQKKNNKKVIREMKDSDWYAQVGDRSRWITANWDK